LKKSRSGVATCKIAAAEISGWAQKRDWNYTVAPIVIASVCNLAIDDRKAKRDARRMNMEPADEFHKLSHHLHEHHYEGEKLARRMETWKSDTTVDAWRHARMYRCLDPLLTCFPGSRWLTVGDGRYGTDAHYLEQHGASAVATDISDTMLRRAQEDGYIREYRKENAEHLSFADNSFDFALCKEAYHHFPRPMLAVYEMLRVARLGIVLIEPDETPVIAPPRHLLKMLVKETLIRCGLRRLFHDRSTNIIDCGLNWYEEVGNFGFCISRREIERVAIALNFRHVAFRGINDSYIEGVENETASPDSALFRKIRDDIEKLDRQCRRGLSRSRPKLLIGIILKRQVDQSLRTALLDAEFEVRDLPRNPRADKQDERKSA
jgi:ubiquinone/menaquinone biosynthesis C-methylase UbiE